MNQTNKAVLWCRVSSKEQEVTGYSLPAQKKLLTEFTTSQGLVPDKVFSVSESASEKSGRQVFHAMLEYLAQSGIKVIVVEKIDRLVRTTKDAVLVNEWIYGDSERKIHFIKESFVLDQSAKSHQMFMWNIKVSVSQFYIDNLSEEVKKGQLAKLQEGWLPTRPPVGYKTVGDHGHKIHVIDDQTAPLVKKMFELYATGNFSILSLTEEVAKLGLHGSTGKPIVKSRIHRLLQEKFYIGVNTWKDIEYPGKQETFIDKELFDRVQALLKGGKNRPPSKSRHNHLFKGLLKCGECDGVITWEIHKGMPYGHCHHYHNCTTRKWAREDNVKKELKKSLKALVVKSPSILSWLRKELSQHSHQQTETHLATLEQFQKQLVEAEKAREKLYDDHLYSKISEERYTTKDKEFEEKVNTITDQIAKLSKYSADVRRVGLSIYDLAQGGDIIFEKVLTDKRQLLMRLVYGKLKLTETQFEFEYREEMEILLKAVAQTNSSKLMKKVLKMENTFEPREKIDLAIQSDAFAPLRSEVLPD